MLPEAGHAVLSAGQFRSTASRHCQGCTIRPAADSGVRPERKDGAATAGVTAGPRAALLGVLSKCGRAPKDVRRSACRGERWRARRCFSGGGEFLRGMPRGMKQQGKHASVSTHRGESPLRCANLEDETMPWRLQRLSLRRGKVCAGRARWSGIGGTLPPERSRGVLMCFGSDAENRSAPDALGFR